MIKRKIQVLDKSVADKIAAGEVVDRPVSIVKELVENSIDSGADSITVEIKAGGKEYIRVTDNGCGIDAADVETAFMRHATSKISSAHDLDSIMTLGFRGEALASICAVSRVEVITKTADSKAGRHVVCDSSRIVTNEPIGCPDGTTITVRDLFYNVPARLKFLGTDGAESRRIIDLVSRLALSFPDIRFRLINGSKAVFNTNGKGNILENIISVYGSDIGRELVPVQADSGDNHIRGFVSNPGFSMSSRMRQVFCVNGRVVSSKVLDKAVDRGYKERLFAGRFPAAFLFLAVPPDKLDVNIHPTKKEIRFNDNAEIEDFAASAIAKALQSKEAVPEVRADIAEPSEKAVLNKKTEQGEQIDVKKLLSTLREETESNSSMQVREPDHYYSSGSAEPTGIEPQKKSPSSLSAIRKPVNVPFDFDELSVLGVLFDTYILATDGIDFFMFDQHAAHERVFYEKLRGQYEASEKFSQQLMMPLNFNVSADVAATEDKWLPVINDMGYSAEFFGNNTYLVREIPAFMDLEEAENFLIDMFNAFAVRPDMSDPAVIDKIIMRSCKSAVKAGDRLDEKEIEGLLDQLKRCVNPFSCPHGRPTFIKMTKYEIERMFKRA